MKISTIKDIARETGLSLATISSYLNGGNVRPKNRKLIEEAICKLDYQVNEIARSLKTDRTNTIGVFIPELDDAYFSKVVALIGTLLNRRGYGMLVVDFGLDEKREVEAVDFLCSKRVDGIIDMPSNKTGEHLERAIKHKVPVVLFDRDVNNQPFHTIKTDNHEAIIIALKHLRDFGHKKIGFMSGDQQIVTAREREEGYLLGCEMYGLKHTKHYISRSDYVTPESAALSFKEIVTNCPDITAVIASNMVSMIGALHSANELGLVIPEDISFVGFDDSRFAKAYHPQLTIVLQPVEEMAEEIVKLMLKQITEQKFENEGVTIFKPYLQYGQSVLQIN